MPHSTSTPNLRLVGLQDEPITNAELVESANYETERSAWKSICVNFTEATGVELEFFDESERPGHNEQLWSCEVPSHQRVRSGNADTQKATEFENQK